MCMFEVDDPVQVYSITHPRSRAASDCIVCNATIAAGEMYERHSWVGEGSAYSNRLCVWCALAHRVFREDPHHRGYPTPNWFASALRVCFAGAEKDDPDAKQWRDLYAGILWRRRAAAVSA